jgi:hypothetical protein
VWVNPKYPRPEQPAPPQEQGERLATLPRNQGEELRINLAEYDGRPYLALRIWARGSDGNLWPVKGKGGSIRVAEIDEVIDALNRAREILAERSPEPARRAR